MLLNEKDKNLSMLPKEDWCMPGHYGTHSQIRITRTWVCTCDFSHLAVTVHLFPSPNPSTDAGLEASLPRLFYMVYDSSPSISRNSTVGPAMLSSTLVAIDTI